MKTIRVLAAAFLLSVALYGCGGGPEMETVPSSSTFKTADELIEEAESREKEQALSKAENLYGQTAGTYYCESSEIDMQFWPSIELTVEGKAVFRANLFTGMGELRGSYTVDGDTVNFVVEEAAFNGFTGENVTDMVFRAVSEGTLELSYTTPDSPVGVTNAGDRFVKKEN